MKPELKKLKLTDKEMVDSYLAWDQHRGCDICFANVYLWSRYYKVGYAIVDDSLIFANPENLTSTSLPYGAPENRKKAIEDLEAIFAEEGKEYAMHLVGPEQFAQIEEWFPGKYQIEYDRDAADYVYDTEKMISLSGKKYHGKKNHINKFKTMYPDWSYETLNEKNAEDCFQMAMQWRNDHDVEKDDEMRAEMAVAMTSLLLFRELDLAGGLIRAEGRVVAFSIGEKLNDDMFVVHIEKAYADVPGAYTIINQQFLEHEASGFRYVNREDDTGSENLRKAKESYHPEFLMEKGLVTRKKELS